MRSLTAATLIASLLAPSFLAYQPALAQSGPSLARIDPAILERDLRPLVAPVALYPDPLLALVLQASTLPEQVTAARRYLDRRRDEPGLASDPNWDSSIVGLLSYPPVLAFMDDQLPWTRQLGDAVIDRLPDLQDSIQRVRAELYAAGTLRSDERQTVFTDGDTYRIQPADPDRIYVPEYRAPSISSAYIEPGSSSYAPDPAYGANSYAGYQQPIYSEPPSLGYSSQSYPSFWNNAAWLAGGGLVGGLLGYYLGGGFDDDDDDNGRDRNRGRYEDWGRYKDRYYTNRDRYYGGYAGQGARTVYVDRRFAGNGRGDEGALRQIARERAFRAQDRERDATQEYRRLQELTGQARADTRATDRVLEQARAEREQAEDARRRAQNLLRERRQALLPQPSRDRRDDNVGNGEGDREQQRRRAVDGLRDGGATGQQERAATRQQEERREQQAREQRQEQQRQQERAAGRQQEERREQQAREQREEQQRQQERAATRQQEERREQQAREQRQEQQRQQERAAGRQQEERREQQAREQRREQQRQQERAATRQQDQTPTREQRQARQERRSAGQGDQADEVVKRRKAE